MVQQKTSAPLLQRSCTKACARRAVYGCCSCDATCRRGRCRAEDALRTHLLVIQMELNSGIWFKCELQEKGCACDTPQSGLCARLHGSGLQGQTRLNAFCSNSYCLYSAVKCGVLAAGAHHAAMQHDAQLVSAVFVGVTWFLNVCRCGYVDHA